MLVTDWICQEFVSTLDKLNPGFILLSDGDAEGTRLPDLRLPLQTLALTLIARGRQCVRSSEVDFPLDDIRAFMLVGEPMPLAALEAAAVFEQSASSGDNMLASDQLRGLQFRFVFSCQNFARTLRSKVEACAFLPVPMPAHDCLQLTATKSTNSTERIFVGS